MDLLFFLKNARNSEAISHLTLTKGNRKLIPYFNRNLLSVDNSMWNHDQLKPKSQSFDL